MPIEIRELVIRAVVSPEAGGKDACGGTERNAAPDQAALVQACVAEVMRQLRLAGEP